MHKKVIVLLLSFLFLSVFIFFSTAQTSRQPISDKGTNFDRTCIGDSCNIVIYSYDRYFNKNGEWEEIDENWYNCGENFCTKNYYFNVTADSNGLVRMNSNERQFNQRISSFRNLNLTLSSPVIRGSLLVYENVLPNIDLRLPYTDDMYSMRLLYNNLTIFNKTLKDNLLSNISIVYTNGTQRVFKFAINNTVNSSENFMFESDSGETIVNSSQNISLTNNELTMAFITYNFTLSGEHTLRSKVRSGSYYDDRKIKITI